MVAGGGGVWAGSAKKMICVVCVAVLADPVEEKQAKAAVSPHSRHSQRGEFYKKWIYKQMRRSSVGQCR